MASSSLPQFHSYSQIHPNNPCKSPPSFAAAARNSCGGGGVAMWGSNEGPEYVVDDMVLPSKVASLGQLGASNMIVPTLPDYSTGSSAIFAGAQNYGLEHGEECGGFMPKFQPVRPNCNASCWGIQGTYLAPAAEEPNNIKVVGRYSEEERKDRILRYLKKRNQRNFTKTIKYACRKTLADRRVRVRGRFARNNELSDDDMVMKKKNNSHQQAKDQHFFDDSVQIKLDEDEEWLQEAMESLANFIRD